MTLGWSNQGSTRTGPTICMITTVFAQCDAVLRMSWSPECHRVRLLRSPALPLTVMYPSPESAFAKTRQVSACLAVELTCA